MSDNDNSEDAPPPIDTLPLDAWHRAKGGRMVEFAGYHMPVQYEGIIAEHLWTRSHAGLFDVSHMGQLVLSGEGVPEALETVLTGDISALKPGRIRYSLLLAENGGILDDLMVTNRGEDWYVVVNGATKWDDIGYLREVLPDAVTINHLEDQALLALQGPEAAEALEAVMPGVSELSFMQAGTFAWGQTELGISRSGYTGEDGFEISVPAERAEALAEALCALPQVKPIALGARDSLRLEAGLPLYGHDLTPDIEPVSAGLAFAISKRRRAEGGFAGAERILSLLNQGAPLQRVGLLLDGRMAAREGAPVLKDNQVVGRVTSGGFSPTLERPIAMAYVDSVYVAEGSTLTIDVRGKQLAATVTTMPFVPHRYHRKGAS